MNRLMFSVLLVLALLAVRTAEGQPRLGGFFEYDNITYFENENRQKINGRNQVILQTDVRHDAGTMVNMFSSLEFRYDQADPTRNRVFLDEAYVDLYLGSLDLRVGRQVYAWGRADLFNPTDNLTAWDYSDILDTEAEKLGLVSARANYYVDNWSLEVVLAPSFSPSVWPGYDSRWWPELPAFIENPAYPQQGSPRLKARYEFANEALPDEGLRSMQYALKLTGFLRGWDFSVSWFDGFDDLPALHLDTTFDSAFTSVLVEVEPRYHRRRAVGADAATTFGSLGVHGEAAYYLTEDWSGTDPAIDDPYLQYVIGADYTLTNVFPEKDLFLLVEWSQEVQVPDRNTVYRLTDLNHVFRKSLFAKADINLDEFSKVTVSGVYNIETEDWWLQSGANWSIADGLELRANLDLLGGPDGSFFGGFKENKRLHVRLKYSF
ncbi:MAG: hypothetical protein BMS9Abin05_2078 [Rhodothermia bacterium]|nr:MAG: hypothetical protein BMS9Abin05_2078 [Rhodothermia bacterium]